MLTHGGVLGRASPLVTVQVLKSVDVAIGILMPVSGLWVANAHHLEPSLMTQGSGKFVVMTGPLSERFTVIPERLLKYSARFSWRLAAMLNGEGVPKEKSDERKKDRMTDDLDIMPYQ